VLAELAREVFTIEIVEPLGREAAARLTELGYGRVKVRIGDGYAGWPEAAPFDRILVTAAAPHLPQPLVDQLGPGGRMVIPIRSGLAGEDLVLVTRAADGTLQRKRVLAVRFVPLTGGGVERHRR
jgi:protein-L-isoaspartate(D-aspartate) O-methyltransferase